MAKIGQGEIDFLFNVRLYDINSGNTQDLFNKNGPVIFYGEDGTNEIIDGINELTNYNITNNNPYLSLIQEIQYLKQPSLDINFQDLAYLKDLGVYPVNKMFVLRRFDNLTSIPVNLVDINNSIPRSVVVGWIKSDKQAAELFSLSFNEEWTTTTKMIPELFMAILKNEFGIPTDNMIPGKKWADALLYGFLVKAQLVSENFSMDNLPIGNPNLLQESPVRAGVDEDGKSQYSLQSSFSIDLEVIYEQKLIGGVDPGVAMSDIMRNLTIMGTSNVEYIGNSNAQLFTSIQDAARSSNSNLVNAWSTVIEKLIGAFIQGITESIEGIRKSVTSTVSNDSSKNEKDKNQTTGQKAASAGDFISSAIKSLATSPAGELGSTLLGPSLQKYKWPLFSSVGVMTGLATTPWHLSIGNPLLPVLSINNIIVGPITITPSYEMGFNDLPKELSVKINVKQGRNFGGQEILSYFNNGYKRSYNTPNSQALKNGTTLQNTTINTQPSQINK